MLAESRELPPWLVTDYVRRHALARGATDAVVLLLDYGQQVLIPLTDEAMGRSATGALSIESTVAGRAFTTQRAVEWPDPDGGLRLHLPLVGGGDRLGVVELRLPALTDAERPEWEEFAAHVTALLLAKSRQTDVYFRARRRQEMSLAAEMQWHLMPPLSVVDPRVALAGIIEPAYDVGGDAFDYAINQETAHLAVFDAMGHGLDAAVMSGVAVAAYRHGRRSGVPVDDMYTLIDSEFAREFGSERFVTAVLANLHLPSGRVHLVNAGHPPPLHIRGTHVLGPIQGQTTLPIGLGGGMYEVVAAQLEPGDRLLLYTDGVSEARRDGELYGDYQLAEDLEHVLADDVPLVEMVRRLNRRLLDWHGGLPTDDATLVLAEWRSRELPGAAVADAGTG